MFIMVHNLELLVGDQVYLGETWALTPACSRAMFVGNSTAKVDYAWTNLKLELSSLQTLRV